MCGDGGFMMNSQEMETAVRLRLNLVVLILQDNAYGMIRWKQAVDSFEMVYLLQKQNLCEIVSPVEGDRRIINWVRCIPES